MATNLELAGQYNFKSPYHKNKKLPFNIESDGYVSTIEYKGWTAYMVQCYYTNEGLNELVNSGKLKPGAVLFPRTRKKDFA